MRNIKSVKLFLHLASPILSFENVYYGARMMQACFTLAYTVFCFVYLMLGFNNYREKTTILQTVCNYEGNLYCVRVSTCTSTSMYPNSCESFTHCWCPLPLLERGCTRVVVRFDRIIIINIDDSKGNHFWHIFSYDRSVILENRLPSCVSYEYNQK